MKSIVVAFALALVATTASYAQEIRSGVYSNLAYNSQSGDLSGTEIFIFPSGPGPTRKYSALVQISEGGAPIAALVPVVLRGASIELTMPAGGVYDGERFVGTFSGDTLLLKWSSGQQERLRRGRSYWQK